MSGAVIFVLIRNLPRTTPTEARLVEVAALGKLPLVHYKLKQELAARLSKEEYTEAKSPFIEDVLVRALRHYRPRTAGP